MTVAELKKAVKNGQFEKVYLFYGEEEYLIFSYLEQFKTALLGEMVDFNCFEFEGETALNLAAEAIEQLPQMSDQKLIILKESGLLKKEDKAAVKMIKEITPDNVVVFVERDFSKISKKMTAIIQAEGEVVNFSRQRPSDLRAWANMRISKAGKRVRNEDLEYLVQICDLSMTKIDLELDKLLASIGDREELKRADIERMITPLLDFKIYELTDSVLKNNTQAAYEALREFKASNEAPTAVLSMLFTQLHFIAMVKNLKMDGEPKIDEFFPANRRFLAGKIAKDTDKYQLSDLYHAMQLCADFDADIKMGRIEGWTAVEIVMASLVATPSKARP